MLLKYSCFLKLPDNKAFASSLVLLMNSTEHKQDVYPNRYVQSLKLKDETHLKKAGRENSLTFFLSRST